MGNVIGSGLFAPSAIRADGLVFHQPSVIITPVDATSAMPYIEGVIGLRRVVAGLVVKAIFLFFYNQMIFSIKWQGEMDMYLNTALLLQKHWVAAFIRGR